MAFFVIITPKVWFAQVPKLQSVIMVTDDLDSLTRAFTKQGFTVTPLRRDPVGLLADQVVFPNNTSLIFETPSVGENWRVEALQSWGRPFVSELRFETSDLDSLRSRIEATGISVVLYDSTDASKGFAIDSTSPIIISFIGDTLRSSPCIHPHGYFRIDWVILGASEDTEELLRRLFDVVGFRKSHRGCCDFWRTGSPQDFTFIRFETPQAPWRGETNWLSIGKNALYFAYH
jgi:hypothetical protein